MGRLAGRLASGQGLHGAWLGAVAQGDEWSLDDKVSLLHYVEQNSHLPRKTACAGWLLTNPTKHMTGDDDDKRARACVEALK